MSVITDAENAFKAVKAFSAFSAAAKGGDGNIVAQLETFALDLVMGVSAKIDYKLPTEKYSTTFNWEGKNWTFTAEVVNGDLKMTADPA